MKGDFTRSTFDPKKHYRSVRMQQGRVQLDADWNEQLDITAHRIETETRDVIGLCGGPLHDEAGNLNAAFRITPFPAPPATPNTSLAIGRGRYYVDGILCQNELPLLPTGQPDLTKPLLVTKQPDLPEDADIVGLLDGTNVRLSAAPPGVYLAYLDVWAQHVTALEDASIREVALGGPDTATRAKNVWQVKLLQGGRLNANLNCDSQINAWDELVKPPNGQMKARSQPGQTSDKPCIIAPGAGFRRLENQLYRVEVHQSGELGAATFKWSRDNGSVVAQWDDKNGDKLTVSTLGRDQVLSFASGQWVELTDDSREQLGQPGTLVQLIKAEGRVLTINPVTATGAVDRTLFPKNPKIRRWDSPGELKIEIPKDNSNNLINDGWLMLEDGVEVKFTTGTYRTGDYWLIPARTATGDVEWPKSDATPPQPMDLFPHGVEHQYCRLALLEFNNGSWKALSDCRELFPPLTELTGLFYVSGDGQEAMPGEALLKPLQAGVANGQWPVAGAQVRFRVTGGTGTLSSGAQSGSALVILTNAQGVAECNWTLDAVNESQQVEATLVDGTHLPVRFNANLSRAQDVAYTPTSKCPDLLTAGVKTVQQALDALCQRSDNDPGIHVKEIGFSSDQILRNDTDIPVSTLVKGIRITCDADVFQGSVRDKPVCFVTLDLPYPFNSADVQLWDNGLIGFQPLILNARIDATDNNIFWIPSDRVRNWLQTLLFPRLRASKLPERLLAHLTLKGNFIWSNKNADHYLDGEVFGVQVAGATNTDVKLGLSGDGKRGGDLEMWFWLVAPSLKVNGVRIVRSPTPELQDSIAVLADPRQGLVLPAQLGPFVIEASFSAALDQASVVSGKSFLISNAATGGAVFAGSITFIRPETLRSFLPNGLPQGRYQVTLKGEGTSPITAQGVALDGDPVALPSGNGVAGGDFTFPLSIS